MWPQNKTTQIFPSTLGLPFGVHYARATYTVPSWNIHDSAVFHLWSGGCGLEWGQKATGGASLRMLVFCRVTLKHLCNNSLNRCWPHRRHKDRQYFGANVLVVVPLAWGPNQVVQTTLTNIKFGTVESWSLMLDEFVVFEGSTALAQWHLRLNFFD